jgi:hypothetical protein
MNKVESLISEAQRSTNSDNDTNTVLVKIMSTLTNYCGTIYSPRNVCPGFKRYRCLLVLCVEYDGEQAETVL